MADPALVLLIVIGASAGERLRGGLVSTAIVDALGRDAHVLVEERASDPPDADTSAVVDRMQGSAVAEVSWADASHTRARLHVYLTSEHAWYDRELAFEPEDKPDERERAVGFLVGAMIRATESAAPPAPAAPAPSPVIPPAIVPPPPPDVVAPARAETTSLVKLDVAGVLTGGIAGDAPALGPGLRGHVVLHPALSAHAGASFGFGSIESAGAHMTTSRIVTGGRWIWLTVARDVSFDVGLDVLVVNHAVRRSDPAADRDRWLTGAHGDLGVAWRWGRHVDAYGCAGVDAVAGNTPITVANEAVAHIPPFRAVGEVGLRFGF